MQFRIYKHLLLEKKKIAIKKRNFSMIYEWRSNINYIFYKLFDANQFYEITSAFCGCRITYMQNQGSS